MTTWINDTWKAISAPWKSKACKGTHSCTRNKHPITVMSTLPPTPKNTTRTVNLLNFPPSGSCASGGHPLPYSMCYFVSFSSWVFTFSLTKRLQKTQKESRSSISLPLSYSIQVSDLCDSLQFYVCLPTFRIHWYKHYISICTILQLLKPVITDFFGHSGGWG